MTEELKDLPPIQEPLDEKELRRVLLAFRERLQTLIAKRGDALNAAVLRRDLIDYGITDEDFNPIGGGAPGPTGAPGPPGAPAPGTTPDLTPPPTVGDLSAIAGFSHIIVEWTGVSYTQGHGNKATHIYAVKKDADDPSLPTFPGEAGRVGSASPGSLTILVLPSDLGIRWHIWAKFESNDGVLSVNPAGGTNGVVAQTGKIGNTDLGPLIVSADKLSAGTYPGINLVPNAGAEDGAVAWGVLQGTLTIANFSADTSDKTSGTRSFRISKPLASNTLGIGSRAFPVIPGETYSVKVRLRTNVASASGLYIRLYLKATEPAGGIVTFALADVVQSFVNNGASNATWTLYEFTYTIPSGMFWASFGVLNWSASSATDTWWDDVSVGRQVTASHLAAGSIAAGSAAIADGAIRRALIELAAIDDARVANMSVSKLIAGILQVGAYIRSTNYVAGSDGFALEGNGFAEFGEAAIRGLISAAKVDTRGLSIKNNAGTILFDQNTPLTSAYIAALIGGGNLLRNSSFELDSDGNGVADYWTSTSFGTGITITRTLVSTAKSGARAARLTVTAISGASNNLHTITQDLADAVPVQAGRSFVASAEFRTSTLQYEARLSVQWFDSTETFISANSINQALTAVNTWERVKTAALVAPAGAVKARIFVGLRRPSAADTTLGHMTIDDVQFEPGELATGYLPSHFDKTGLDNPITAANIAAYMGALAIGEAYIQDLAVTNAKWGGYLQSDDYVAGSDGWRIEKSGFAEFRDVLVRGDVQATSVNGASGTFGTVTAGLLRNSTNTARINLNATGSQDFLVAGSGAVRITADGDAFFLKTLASGSWSGSVDLIVAGTTPDVVIEVDTGFNITLNQFYARNLTARFSDLSVSYSPAESSGNFIATIQTETAIAVRTPLFANSTENPGQNPYGTGQQRVFILMRLRCTDRDAANVLKNTLRVTGFDWTVDTIG